MNKVIMKASCSDKKVLDVSIGLYAYPAILIAHRRGFFRSLNEKGKTITELAEELGLHRRPVEGLLVVLRAAGLVERVDDKHLLTEVSKTFLIEGAPNYFGYFWDMLYENSENFSIASLERAILANKPQIYGENELFEAHTTGHAKAQHFTRAMHGLSIGSASVWPHGLDLSRHQVLLDIGGASGAHSLCAVSHWRNLKAIVYDLPEIYEITMEYIIEYELQEAVSTHSGDMWKDPFPEADIHFYSNIFHDWESEQNRFLALKSYQTLPEKGRIILHELLYEDDCSGPLAAAGMSVMMLNWTVGQQYSGQELTELLRGCGFRNVEIRKSLGYYSIVTGVK